MNQSQSEPKSNPARGPLLPGRYAIVAIAVIAVGAATGNLWYQRYLLRKPLEVFGKNAVLLLARAPHAEVWRLRPAESSAVAPADAPRPSLDRADEWVDRLELEGTVLDVVERATASQARGFTHVRRALCQSTTYDWRASPVESAGTAAYALVVADAADRAVLVFSENARQVWLANRSAAVNLQPAASQGFWAFLTEQFPAAGKPLDSAAAEVQIQRPPPGSAEVVPATQPTESTVP